MPEKGLNAIRRAVPSSALVLGGVAVSAAVGVLFGVAEQEDGVQLRLADCDAAGILAVDDVHQLLGQLQVLFLHTLAVADDVDGDVGVDIAQHVQIHLHGGVDLDDVLLSPCGRCGRF